jgi:hypothetical protein
LLVSGLVFSLALQGGNVFADCVGESTDVGGDNTYYGEYYDPPHSGFLTGLAGHVGSSTWYFATENPSGVYRVEGIFETVSQVNVEYYPGGDITGIALIPNGVVLCDNTNVHLYHFDGNTLVHDEMIPVQTAGNILHVAAAFQLHATVNIPELGYALYVEHGAWPSATYISRVVDMQGNVSAPVFTYSSGISSDTWFNIIEFDEDLDPPSPLCNAMVQVLHLLYNLGPDGEVFGGEYDGYEQWGNCGQGGGLAFIQGWVVDGRKGSEEVHCMFAYDEWVPPNLGWSVQQYMLALPEQVLLKGDMDCDGTVDIAVDLPLFVDAILDPTGYVPPPGCTIDPADMNDDGSYDGSDIPVFVDAVVP